MKYYQIGAIFIFFSFILFPIQSKAAVIQTPLDMYGYTDSISNLWTNDTVDAQDNDLPGDVDWFLPVPGFNFNNPREVYLGGLKKFSGFSINIGNSPLQAGQTAKFDFFYGAIVNNNVEFKPLQVKDMDGGLSVSNRTYRYTFAPPADWNNTLSPHVQAPSMYYLKMVCKDNCVNGGPNGNFQINQITIQQEVSIPMLPRNNVCALQPFNIQCFPHL